MIIQFFLYILSIICATYVIYDVWVNGHQDKGIKLLWTILALAFNVMTFVIYLIVKSRR